MAVFGFPDGRGNNEPLFAAGERFTLVIGANGSGGANLWETTDGTEWELLSTLDAPVVHDATNWRDEYVVIGADKGKMTPTRW